MISNASLADDVESEIGLSNMSLASPTDAFGASTVASSGPPLEPSPEPEGPPLELPELDDVGPDEPPELDDVAPDEPDEPPEPDDAPLELNEVVPDEPDELPASDAPERPATVPPQDASSTTIATPDRVTARKSAIARLLILIISEA